MFVTERRHNDSYRLKCVASTTRELQNSCETFNLHFNSKCYATYIKVYNAFKYLSDPGSFEKRINLEIIILKSERLNLNKRSLLMTKKKKKKCESY